MYMIQAKAPGMKRFMLLDVNAGEVVKLAFYATIFNTKEQAEDCIKKLTAINPDIQLKLKKC